MVELVLSAGISLVASAFGSSIISTVVGVAAAAVGSYVDSQYLFPLLFPAEDGTGEEETFKAITISSSQEGSSYPYCLGPKCRVPGIIIYMSDPWSTQAKADTLPTMGKGGGGSRPHVQPITQWWCNVRIAFNYSHEGSAIKQLERILGNGRLLYEYEHTLHTEGQIGATNPAWNPNSAYFARFPGVPGDEVHFEIFKPTSLPEVQPIDVDGFSPGYPVNDGEHDVLFYAIDMGGLQYLFVEETLTSAAEHTVTIDQLLSGFFSNYLSSMKVYDGAMDQDADEANDILDDIYGGTGATGKWPCYRGVANASFHNLYLTQFANQMPRFDLIVRAHDEGYKYSEAIQKICEDAGVATADIDVTGINTNQELDGAVFYGPRKAKHWLQNLMLAGNILYQRDGTTLKFFSRPNISEYTIKDEDVGLFEINGSPSAEAEITDLQHMDIPGGVIVDFFDKHDNMQKASEEYNVDDRYDAFNSQNTLKYEFQVTMSHAEARSIAQRQLWLARAGRQYCRIRVPFKYCYILENDVVLFTKYGREWRFVVQKKDRSNNGLIVLEGPYTPSSMDNWSYEDFETTSINVGMGLPSYIDGNILDIAPLHDDHVNNPGLYAFACGKYAAAQYEGCELWQSDDDVDYYQLAQLVESAGMCDCLTILGGGVSADYWDEVNTLQVYTKQKDLVLESCTKLECQNGLNRIAVKTSTGWEVMGFADVQVDVTMVNGPTKYTISTLLRGLCNTEDKIDSHGASETAVVLTAPGIYHIPMNTQVKNRTKYYKFVPFGGDESDYSGVAHTVNLGTVSPPQPCHIAGSRDTSNNLTVTWDYRTRAISRMFAVAKPVDDFVKAYEIDFYDGATIVRTVRNDDLTGDMEHDYTAAQQTTDGLTPGDPVKLKMYQMSPIVGRGRGLEVTI